MEKEKNKVISEADENGIRYYDLSVEGETPNQNSFQKHETVEEIIVGVQEQDDSAEPCEHGTYVTAEAQVETVAKNKNAEGNCDYASARIKDEARFQEAQNINKSAANVGKNSSKFKRNLLIFVGIIIGVMLLAGACAGLANSGEVAIYPEEPYIARLNIEGTIQSTGNEDYFGNPAGYQHQWTLDTIDDLIVDENNKGIILFVDTPGGGVYESDELYFKIKEYQEQTGRPVYSAMATMAASGGYYISAPCDKIIANRNCWTGSIGVTMGSYLDFSELLEKYGVKVNTITSGGNKAMGSSLEPMTEEQRAIFQSLVDDAYEQFVGIVAEGRGLTLEETYALADGRIYTAKQALKLNLIDAIGTYEQALADMAKSYNLEDCIVTELEPEGEDNLLGSLFGNINFEALRGNGDVEAIVKLAEKEAKFPVSYMCEVLLR